ncbi:CoxG family protein [Aquabacterium sp. J223]|uniref:CoxG family protein n=1 Tax=Aquabacterium sp. J223 TaxID=2898431 RepID=UPI0021AD65F6|nr:carbon monoxide dehydrogenase subunit G [Aquabacterium sp. J223]UUX95229.1 carbon monoxide dehydrogenase subunit G [Aquabacterium sp. J223]
MDIQGETLLAVPRPAVWQGLNDPAVLQRCLPGCDTFEADGPDRYRVALQATVGPIRARFAGTLRLHDIRPGTGYSLTFDGSGGVAGFGKGSAQVTLEDVGESTRLRYVSKAQVGGRLAQVGGRLIDGVTKRMTDDFFARFARELEGPGRAAGVAASAAGAAHATSSETTATVAPAPVPVQPSDGPAQGPARPMAASGNAVAVIAAAVSATAASVAVLAALLAFQFGRG